MIASNLLCAYAPMPRGVHKIVWVGLVKLHMRANTAWDHQLRACVSRMQTVMAASLSSLLLCLLLAGGVLAQPGPPVTDPPPQIRDGCAGPADDGQVICYTSTGCRGGRSDDPVSSAAECCSGRGLSYCDENGCADCFSEWFVWLACCTRITSQCLFAAARCFRGVLDEIFAVPW